MFSKPYTDPDISIPLNFNSNAYDPVIANEMEAVSCDHPYYPCDEGIFDYIPRHGKYQPFCTYNLTAASNKTAVILGNSFAYMQNKGILIAIKEAKTKFKKVYFLIAFGCNPMTGAFDAAIAPQCRTADELHSEFLNLLKPDIIIFSALLSHIKELQTKAPSPDEIVKNSIYPQLQNLLRYANYTKKFIIIEPHPALTEGGKYKTPLSISEALIAGKDLSQYKKLIESYENGDNNAWKWIQPVINECKNCKVVTTKDIFCDKNECDFIDRKTMLGLYCDEGHISPRTSLRLVPKIKYAIDH
uniref:SGNH domain-containing protein n=1 Tax=Panagrolaimus superbus TaxID=310955 RepID=A0A914Y0Y9_9BILA